jgi:hypothetical protein
MKREDLEQLRYPIGKANIPTTITSNQVKEWIQFLEKFPKKLTELVVNLKDEQLDTPYRPEGWTIRQVVHHLADSHHHSYSRFKWALTEETPLIKVYYEERWAELHDSKSAPILLSLNALTSTHAKLVYLLKGLSNEELQTIFIHPEGNEEISLKVNIGVYAWHSQHHYAHIENLMIRKEWI